VRDSRFFAQADLLVQVLPFVHAETCFALKGGTAINFFVRDFPRLSVDIDLTYLPLEDRAATLAGIDAALKRIAASVHRAMPGVKVHAQRPHNGGGAVKLLLHLAGGAMVKIEPSTILRGTLFPTTDRKLAPRAAEVFGRSVTMRVVSLPDLYGGKLCAALDRQHPRDLFDVHEWLRAEGLTDDIRRAFVVYLASHDRPMAELLAPRLKDLRQVHAEQFSGMTREPIALAVLEEARRELIGKINAELTSAERAFLLALKEGEPRWELLDLPNAERLPGPRWKLQNLAKMSPANHAQAVQRLREQLGL